MSEGDVQPPGGPMVVAEAKDIGDWTSDLGCVKEPF